MKQEASKSDRNLSFCGPFLHQLHPSQAEFTKLDNFLAAVELYPVDWMAERWCVC